MSNIRTIAPAIEPVTVAEQKVFMRLPADNAADDTLVTLLIAAAREYVEKETHLALITQTWKYTLDRIPLAGSEEPWWDGVREMAIGELYVAATSIELPTYPLIAITSFNTYNSADTATLFTGFYTDTARKPGRISLRTGAIWPVSTRGVNGVEIIYTAGFGAAAANVPADLRIAVMQIASHWYENRELMTFELSTRDIPFSAGQILKRHKIRSL